jgi:hypothetical protein
MAQKSINSTSGIMKSSNSRIVYVIGALSPVHTNNDIKKKSSTRFEEVLSKRFSVFPNPFTEYLHIASLDNNTQISSIEIFDLSGKSLLYLSCYSLFEKLDLRDFSSGSYIGHITYDNFNVEMFNLIKK